jgi:hypothetical protein
MIARYGTGGMGGARVGCAIGQGLVGGARVGRAIGRELVGGTGWWDGLAGARGRVACLLSWSGPVSGRVGICFLVIVIIINIVIAPPVPGVIGHYFAIFGRAAAIQSCGLFRRNRYRAHSRLDRLLGCIRVENALLPRPIARNDGWRMEPSSLSVANSELSCSTAARL